MPCKRFETTGFSPWSIHFNMKIGAKRNYHLIKKFCLAQGVDLFGVADIRPIKNEIAISVKVLEKLDRAVSLGTRLSTAILEEIEASPTRLYYYHYKTLNALIDQTDYTNR